MSEQKKSNTTVNNQATQMVDELGRVLIPLNLRNQLGLKSGGKLSATSITRDNFIHISLTESDEGEMQLDNLNRITLTYFQRETLGWNFGDEVTLSLDEEIDAIMLHPKCA